MFADLSFMVTTRLGSSPGKPLEIALLQGYADFVGMATHDCWVCFEGQMSSLCDFNYNSLMPSKDKYLIVQ